MKLSSVCDKCGKDPIPFRCGNDDMYFSPEEEDTAHYHLIPRDCEEPLVLMSNGDLMFKVAALKEHPILEDEIFICSDCFEDMFSEQLDEEDDDNEEEPWQ